MTGATGFIGKHLCAALFTLGAEVHGLARTPTKQESIHQLWAVDLLDLESVKAVITQTHPEIVYHLAGMVTARQDRDLILPTLRSNLLGTIHLLLALSEVGCERLVIAGSSEELGTDGGVPGSPYAAAKLASTQYALMFQRLYGVPASVARIYMSYGPGQSPDKLVPYVARCLLTGTSPKLSNGARVCDFTYVLDIVRGLLLVACQPAVQVVGLGTGKGVTIRDVVEMLVALTGSASRPEYGAIPSRVGERAHVASLSATQRALSWEPRWSLREGLTETVTWCKAELIRERDGS